MKKNWQQLAMSIGCVVFLAACGSSSTSSTEREITGSVAGANASLSKAAGGAPDCAADTIQATTVAGEVVTADVATDCSFSLSLAVDQSYLIGLAKDDAFVASLVFDTGSGAFTSSVLTLTSGAAIDLGLISIAGQVATAEFNPLEEVDRDDDGVSDYEDSDDDNDEVEDNDEGDCDLDGIIDDDDASEDDDSCSAEEAGSARVLEIKPRNDPHPELGDDLVDLDKEVRARFSCTVDQSSVTSDTFTLVGDDESVIECSFEFSGRGHDGNTVTCKHEGQDFSADTTYTLTISGVTCDDATVVPDKTVTWKTKAEDNDDGDAEDDIDNSDDDVDGSDDNVEDGSDNSGGDSEDNSDDSEED